MSTFQSRSDFITAFRQACTDLLASLETLQTLQTRWDDGDMAEAVVDASGTDPSAQGYAAGDFQNHQGLMKFQINNTLLAFDEMKAALDANNATVAGDQTNRALFETVRY